MSIPQKPQTVNEYIESAPESSREKLEELLQCLREVTPKAEESLKWGTPAFTKKRILFTVAAYKNHVSFYPTPAAIKAFTNDLADFVTSSSTIQFPLDKPLPVDLIQKIARYRLKDSDENDARWM